MLDESFTFGGKNARTMGIELTEPITISQAVPKIYTVSIPGMNGDLHYYEGTYSNRKVTAKCFMISGTLQNDINKINAWLLGEHGYRKLIIDGDPQHYMMGRVTSGIQTQIIQDVLNNTFSITFDCKPQRFLNYGDNEEDVTTTLSIYNPTEFESSPIIALTATGDGSATIGGKTISTTYVGTLYYDCETDTAYNGDTNLNENISVDDIITLYPGNNAITKTDNISEIKIVPRWWEI